MVANVVAKEKLQYWRLTGNDGARELASAAINVQNENHQIAGGQCPAFMAGPADCTSGVKAALEQEAAGAPQWTFNPIKSKPGQFTVTHKVGRLGGCAASLGRTAARSLYWMP